MTQPPAPAPPPYDPRVQPLPTPLPNHPAAVPSLVLGILSVVACGLFTGIPAMVMGRRATREIRADRARYGGEGMAQAGFWTGLVGTALTGLVVLLIAGMFALGGVMHSNYQESCEQIVNGQHPHQVHERCP